MDDVYAKCAAAKSPRLKSALPFSRSVWAALSLISDIGGTLRTGGGGRDVIGDGFWGATVGFDEEGLAGGICFAEPSNRSGSDAVTGGG